MLRKAGNSMAVMDEFKEERAALKNGTFKQKLSYFIEYYKWYVIVPVLVLLFGAYTVYEIVTTKDVAFYSVMLNGTALEGATQSSQEFAELINLDTEKYTIMWDSSMHIQEAGMDEISYTSVQKLVTYTAAAELDTMVSDSTSFRKYANSSTFYDVRNLLTEEQIAKFEPYFYYVDWKVVEEIEAANNAMDDTFVPTYPDPTKPEEMEQPVPVGIYVSDCKKLTDNFYFKEEDIVLGVYSNSTRPELAVTYLEYLFSE